MGFLMRSNLQIDELWEKVKALPEKQRKEFFACFNVAEKFLQEDKENFACTMFWKALVLIGLR